MDRSTIWCMPISAVVDLKKSRLPEMNEICRLIDNRMPSKVRNPPTTLVARVQHLGAQALRSPPGHQGVDARKSEFLPGLSRPILV